MTPRTVRPSSAEKALGSSDILAVIFFPCSTSAAVYGFSFAVWANPAAVKTDVFLFFLFFGAWPYC
jgi:nitrate reductase NapE component